MGATRGNHDRLIGTSEDGVVRLILEEERDNTGVHNQSAPDIIGDTVSPQQTGWNGVVVEYFGRTSQP